MLTKLKQKVQQIFATEARVANQMGLTPNTISVIGLVLAFLSSLLYAEWRINPYCLLSATALLLLSGFCDALDGIVARLYQKTTVFGGFLDSLLDRYADAAICIGIVVGGLCDALWGMVALTGSLLVSYSRARAEVSGLKMESVGIAERAERMIILAAASVVATFWQTTMVMNAGIILLAILTNLTVLQRALYIYGGLNKRKRG